MPREVEVGAYDTLVGRTIANRYLIEVRLGEGAMGAVYRARHIKVGRPFAVKFLHPQLLVDGKILARFEREAELAGRLHHPNVIGVVDVGQTDDGMSYMVMDLAEGPDLASVLSEAPMPAQRIIHLTRQLLEGLFHAHEQGLIHRDFKPENVIVERDSHQDEVPRIVDFGIAILREGGDSSDAPGRLTTGGMVLGTPHYMAPEQAVADPIDHRIDLFALGIMVYEMLCGKLPFDGSGVEVARANLLLDPPLISQRVPSLEVDPLLEAFARRLMAKKRDVRPATAKVARDLLDLIEKNREAAASALGVPLEAERPPRSTQPNQPIRHSSGDSTYPPPMPTAMRSREYAISTEPTEPLEVKKRRAPLIGALVVGIGILVAAAVVVFTGDKGKKSPTNADPIAMASDRTSTPTPPPSVPPRPDTIGAGSGVGSGAGSSVSVVQPDNAGSDATSAGPDRGSTTPGVVGAQQHTGSNSTTRVAAKATTKASNKKAQTTTKPATPALAAAKPQTTTVDANALASQYASVGAQLKALETAKGRDAVSDLWQRYRYVRLNQAIVSQQKRDEAAQILSKLMTEISSRK